MTELEQLARETLAKINSLGDCWIDKRLSVTLEALTTAYNLGRHDAYNGQRAAARINGPKGGRPKGSKDIRPRTRRSKTQIAQEVKP